MHERQVVQAERLRSDEILSRKHPFAKQLLLEKRILRDGEWVACRQGKVVPGMVATLHGGE